MHPETLGQIILKSLELALLIAHDIPAEDRRQFWIDHQQRLDRIEKFFRREEKD